jgi:hypothetical protein
MRKATLGDRLRYAFDNTLARGPVAQIAWLGMVSLGVILLAALLVTLARVSPQDGPPLAFHEAAWLSLMRPRSGNDGRRRRWDSARHAGRDVRHFVISTLIGHPPAPIAGAERLGKGRAQIESAHRDSGWSDQVF